MSQLINMNKKSLMFIVSIEMLASRREELWSRSRQLSHSVVTQTMPIYPINTTGVDYVVSFLKVCFF